MAMKVQKPIDKGPLYLEALQQPESSSSCWQNRLTNTYRLLNPERRQYTFQDQTRQEEGRLQECKIISNNFSNHEGYMISYMPRNRPVIQRNTGGTKTWKLNNQLLGDSSITDRVEIILHQFEDECFDLDPTQAWDKTKNIVRNYTITRSIQLGKKNKHCTK